MLGLGKRIDALCRFGLTVLGFPPPSKESKDGPEGAAVIGFLGEVLLGHFADSGWIENSGGSNEGGVGEVFGPAAKILL